MADEMSQMEHRITQFEELVQEMREETRQANIVLRKIRSERQELEKLIGGRDIPRLINDKITIAVKTELGDIHTLIRESLRKIILEIGEVSEPDQTT